MSDNGKGSTAMAERMAKVRAARKPRGSGIAPVEITPDLKSLLDQMETTRLKIENHLNEHWLQEEALKPKPWVYRCSVRGCTELFTLPPPEDRVGQPAPSCPRHGAVELYPISTPVAGYGNQG